MDMKQTKGDPSSLQPEAGLRIIKKSKSFIFLFIIAVVLSYLATDIQERQLICAIRQSALKTARQTGCEGLPDPCCIRIAAGLLSLWGLVFFYALGVKTASAPAADVRAERRNKIGCLAGLLSLAAGVLRLWAVLDECGSLASGADRVSEADEDGFL